MPFRRKLYIRFWPYCSIPGLFRYRPGGCHEMYDCWPFFYLCQLGSWLNSQAVTINAMRHLLWEQSESSRKAPRECDLKRLLLLRRNNWSSNLHCKPGRCSYRRLCCRYYHRGKNLAPQQPGHYRGIHWRWPDRTRSGSHA